MAAFMCDDTHYEVSGAHKEAAEKLEFASGFEAMVAAREYLKTLPAAAPLLSKELPVRSGEVEEPYGRPDEASAWYSLQHH